MKRPCATLREIGSKSVPSHITLHFVFVGQRWHGTCWILSIKGLVEEEKVPEAPTDSEIGFLESLEVGLHGQEPRLIHDSNHPFGEESRT